MVQKYLIKICFIVSFYTTAFQAQSVMTTINHEMPNYADASPTVASLMKFEEVPVNNYTGIPDISIPLFNIPTQNKDFNIPISVNYHPNSITYETVASYVGLGWNLFAGGSISRTVRGLPDEIKVLGNSSKIGIYYNDLGVGSNNYYNFENFSNNTNFTDLGEFLWGSFVSGRNDAEHDLYQFNISGRTGRFIIKKNTQTGGFEVVKLFNDQFLDISVDISMVSDVYKINNFKVIDENGFVYVFKESDAETTIDSKSSINESFLNSYGASVVSNGALNYKSAYQLSEVRDVNNNLLVSFNYQNIYEKTSNSQNIYSNILNMDVPFIKQNYSDGNVDNKFLVGLAPAFSSNISQKRIATKKIANINITGVGSLVFTNSTTRNDSNILASEGALLNEIELKDIYDNSIKKIKFNYYYQSHNISNLESNFKRLMLRSIDEYGNNNEDKMTHRFDYKTAYYQGRTEPITKDKWGYLFYKSQHHENPNNDADYALDILEKITYPTKGAVVFDFERNSFSYIGNQVVTDLQENPDNFVNTYFNNINLVTASINATPATYNLGIFLRETVVSYDATYSPEAFFSLERINPSNPSQTLPITYISQSPKTFIALPGFQYRFILRSPFRESPGLSASVSATISNLKFSYRTDEFKYLYGGGVRIKKIGYFDDGAVEQDYFRLEEPLSAAPFKTINYNYNLFGSKLTSGVLVYPIPRFEYEYGTNVIAGHPFGIGIVYVNLSPNGGPITYSARTNYNVYGATKTKGSDVGYRNVTVSQTDLGKTEYTYTSAFEFPQLNVPPNYPFYPTKDRDYERGFLTEKKVYKQNNYFFIPIIKEQYSYTLNASDKGSVVYGFSPANIQTKCSMSGTFGSYAQYMYCINNDCGHEWKNLCNTSFFLNFERSTEDFAWKKLSSKITTEYFNDNQNDHITTQEYFQYHPTYKVMNQHTMINALGESYVSNATHVVFNSATSRKLEVTKTNKLLNNEMIEFKEVVFSNNFLNNSSYLPTQIFVGNNEANKTLRLSFLSYDQFGKVVQVRASNDINVKYLWGYNNTKVVAKLEGADFNNINQNLISSVISTSNSNNQAALISSIEALKAGVNNNEIQISGFTHKPLVGVSTAIDVKPNLFTNYNYDNFNRLFRVLDFDNNTLMKHLYNYRN